MSIKNIIFDLGGVLLDLDFNLTIKAFNRLGIVNFDFNQECLFEFEVGKLTAADFRKIINCNHKTAISDSEFDQAWNAMLLTIPKEKLDFIKDLKIKNGYKTYLFSNTNEIHLQAFRQRHGADVFSGCFDREYYSNEFKKRKPDPDAFNTILRENQLASKETLFLDDSMQHIESARRIGMRAELVTKEMTLLHILEKLKRK